MNINFAVVDMETGAIRSAGFGPADGLKHLTLPNEAVIEAPMPVGYQTHWFDGGEFKPLVELDAVCDKHLIDADGIDQATISGLPVPCQVYVDGLVYEVLDGSLELTVTDPGRYYITINHPGFVEKEWIIDAS